MPLFSVVLPTYNRANWLKRSIQSVLEQTFEDFELIIVDDGSTDNTRDVISGFADSRILYHYQENKERSAARNAGIKLASGDYVCFLDSDDVYLPWHLETLKKALEYFDFSPQLIFTDIDEISRVRNHHTEVGPNFSQKTYKLLTPSESFEYVLLKPVGCMRWCVKNQLIRKRLFDEHLRVGEDVELFTRLLSDVNAVLHIEAVSVLYSEHPERTVNEGGAYLQNLIVLNKIFSTSPLAADKKDLKRVCLHRNYMALARYYQRTGNRLETYKYLLKSFITRPFSNIKEKIFLSVDSFRR